MFVYKIIESDRKSICIQVTQSGEIVVRVPYGYSKDKIENFVIKNSVWIEKTKNKQKEVSSKHVELSRDDVLNLKKLAAKKINDKVEYYSELMGVKPTGVKITSAQKRFGSCNAKNSLCFSYILMLYPDDAIDYVVVHELAHIKHHNHSREFYNFVSLYLSDYKEREKLLASQQKIPDFSEV